MRNLSIVLSVLGAAITFSGCSTMYFHNGVQETTQTDTSEWHHDGILGLVEFSDSVDMNHRCDSKSWATVKVESTFVQGIVRQVTSNLYDPWEVSFKCQE